MFEILRSKTMNPLLSIVLITDGDNLIAGQPEAQSWHIVQPETLLEAMAASVFYAPHAVVILGDTPWLHDAALNFATMTGPSARNRDILVRVSDQPLNIETPNWLTLIELPTDTVGSELVNAIRQAVLHTSAPQIA
jgi:hypothetical protein